MKVPRNNMNIHKYNYPHFNLFVRSVKAETESEKRQGMFEFGLSANTDIKADDEDVLS